MPPRPDHTAPSVTAAPLVCDGITVPAVTGAGGGTVPPMLPARSGNPAASQQELAAERDISDRTVLAAVPGGHHRPGRGRSPMTHPTDRAGAVPGGFPPPGPGRPGRHANHQKVTERNSPVSKVSTGEFESGPAERETGPEVSSLQSDRQSNLATFREQVLATLQAARAYCTPPSLITEQPASLAELANYARWGGWTSRTDGRLRRLGIAWHYGVGLPVTAVCRYVEWIAQRPGRAIPVFVLWKLLVATGPGPWLVAHIIDPVLGLAAWVLL